MEEDDWPTTEAEKRRRARSLKRAWKRWSKMRGKPSYTPWTIIKYASKGPALIMALRVYFCRKRIKNKEYHRRYTKNWMKKKYKRQETSFGTSQEKGKLLEKAVSRALEILGIPHEHNPFDQNYPKYEGKTGDILIPELNLIIECKNLAYWPSKYTHKEWLKREVTHRKGTEKYKYRILVVSHSLPPKMQKYLNFHGWKLYIIGHQVTPENYSATINLLRRKFYWLPKWYNRLVSE